jgi:hypothetical protein
LEKDNLQEIEPVAGLGRTFAGLYQDYRARLDAATAQKSATVLA